jgi:multiple sugar transport system ATP-binding protein
MTMADRIVVLRAGKVEQVGTPLELYNHPANRFVAGFIGSPQMNFLNGQRRRRGRRAHSGSARCHGKRGAEGVPLRGCRVSPESRPSSSGIRPEHIGLGAATAPSLSLPAKIDRIEQLGASSFLYLPRRCRRAADRARARAGPHVSGETVTVTLPVADTPSLRAR